MYRCAHICTNHESYHITDAITNNNTLAKSDDEPYCISNSIANIITIANPNNESYRVTDAVANNNAIAKSNN